MDLVETALDRVPILFRKKLTRQLDRNCVFLADVAHIGRTLYYDGLWTDLADVEIASWPSSSIDE